MVQGQQARQIVVVDLDGTIIDGNSLHIYIKEGWRLAPVRTKLSIALLLVARKMRLISHRRMKFGALRRINPTPQLRSRFVARFDALRRQSVADIIDRYARQDATVLLATAAPDVYIPWVWSGPFLATPLQSNPAMDECRGTNKLAAVRKWMQPHDTMEAVITDHADDMALLAAGARCNYLVAPSPATLAAASMAGIRFNLVEQ